jgi:hypothetical protein
MPMATSMKIARNCTQHTILFWPFARKAQITFGAVAKDNHIICGGDAKSSTVDYILPSHLLQVAAKKSIQKQQARLKFLREEQNIEPHAKFQAELAKLHSTPNMYCTNMYCTYCNTGVYRQCPEFTGSVRSLQAVSGVYRQ